MRSWEKNTFQADFAAKEGGVIRISDAVQAKVAQRIEQLN